jgi:cytochrome b561
MQLRNSPHGYGAVAKFLHWSIVILIIAQYVIIESTEDMADGPQKSQVMGLHMSVGMLVFGLALVRIAWKLTSGGKPEPVPMPGPQRIAAAAGHGLLYLLIIAQPLTGWVMASYGGHAPSFFGLFDFPMLVGENHDMHETFEEVHEVLFFTLVGVAVLHVLAALYHHFVMKDNSLRRMLPFVQSRSD